MGSGGQKKQREKFRAALPTGATLGSFFGRGASSKEPEATAKSPATPDAGRLSLPEGIAKRPSSSGSSSVSTAATASGNEDLKPLDPGDLVKLLADPSAAADTLILDIRPSTAFCAGHVLGAVNICAPSTLLKRKAVTVQRIEDTLLVAQGAERSKFLRWRVGAAADAPTSTSTPPEEDALPLQRIIAMDLDTERLGDSGSASAGGGGPCLAGLLQKFQDAGFKGELCWLSGGFSRFSHEHRGGGGGPSFIEASQPQADKASDSRRASAPFFGGGFGLSEFKLAHPFGGQQRHNSAQSTASLGKLKLPSGNLSDAHSPAAGRDMDSQRSSLIHPRGLPMDAFTTRSTVHGGGNDSGPPGRPSSTAQNDCCDDEDLTSATALPPANAGPSSVSHLAVCC